MTEPTQIAAARPKLAEARKALTCLYIAVEKDIADDVREKVEAAIKEAESAERPAPQPPCEPCDALFWARITEQVIIAVDRARYDGDVTTYNLTNRIRNIFTEIQNAAKDSFKNIICGGSVSHDAGGKVRAESWIGELPAPPAAQEPTAKKPTKQAIHLDLDEYQ